MVAGAQRFAGAAAPPPSQPEVGSWSGSQAGDAGPGATSRLWTVRMGHPTEGWGSGDCEAPAEGLHIRPYAPTPPSLKEPPTPEPSSRPLQGFRALGVQWRGGGTGSWSLVKEARGLKPRARLVPTEERALHYPPAQLSVAIDRPWPERPPIDGQHVIY
uniref:Uncharacterized protein n=1 Tax=Rangifer tarandus platyrhynchus TaxID=3082113 RepID=A0ACB0EXN8_RANTA|nr:unnamed protein product [Rangifer tarandus platyrhynchus]